MDRRRRRLVWGAVYGSTAVLVALGTLGLLARVSPPATDWVPQVAAIGLPVVASLSAVVAAGLAVAVARSWRPGAALCAVACAAVSVGSLADPPEPDAPPAPIEESHVVRLVTINLGDAAGREGEVGGYVAASDADVVVLQEAGGGGQPYHLAVARITSEGYEPLVSPGGLGRQVVLTRLPAVSYEAGYLGQHGVHAGVYGRAVLRVAGREVAVYNVHLRSFGRWRESLGPGSLAGLRDDIVQRAEEAEYLRGLLDAETLPYVVAGDLNSTPDQWAYRRVAAGTRDALAIKGGLLTGTYPSAFPLTQIDAVLASPEFGVVDAGVGPRGLSDHRPVQAALSLGRAPARPAPGRPSR